MRIRSLKPEFFKNETLADLPPHARLLFQGLWLLADSAGRLVDRPKRIRAEVFPYEDVDVHGLLAQLAGAGFIVRYEVDGENYLAVRGFRKHQRISGKEAETPSEIPPVPTGEASGKQSGLIREAETEADGDDAVASPVSISETQAPVQPGKQSRSSDRFTIALEGKGKEGKGEGSAPAHSRVDETDPHGRWTYERLQPWVKAIRVIGGIRELDADGWPTWKRHVDRFGIQAVVAATAALHPNVRYPNRVEAYLIEHAPPPPEPIDPLTDATTSAVRSHGWERCFRLAGFDDAQVARVIAEATDEAIAPEAKALEVLTRENRPAARVMLAKLGGAAASGAA